MATNLYEALWADLRGPVAALVEHRRRRRRRLAVSAVACGAVLAAAGAALAAASLLGWPAPAHVRQDLAGVDAGLPSDLRLNPDVEHARAVATGTSSVLYAADLSGGGHCTEIVTAGDRGRGAVCTTAAGVTHEPIELTVPSDDDPDPSSPVTVAGRLNVPARTLEITYGSVTRQIPLGNDGYFVFDVPPDDRAGAHSSEVVVTAHDVDGATVARATVPADWDQPAVPDDRAPLYASTRSDAHDFTKVYGIEGHVSAPGAARLQLRYADGTRVDIPIDPNGDFLYDVPAARIGSFMRPQQLVATDPRGAVVAQTHVAAVAYWRGEQRHR